MACCQSMAACCIRPKGAVGLPVDAGWAWVMVAAAGGVFGFQGAAFKLFGMIYVEMMDHFGSDRKVTLWVFSVSGMVTLLSGPVVSMYVQKTSHRCVIATGSLCMALGIITTGFAPSVEATFFTFGVVYAFGVTCLLICGLTCTAPYFSKYRGLAVGITASCNGVLAFILPNVLRMLFDSFPFSYALLLYGGIALHILILAMLVRSPSFYTKDKHSCLHTCCGFDVAASIVCCGTASSSAAAAAADDVVACKDSSCNEKGQAADCDSACATVATELTSEKASVNGLAEVVQVQPSQCEVPGGADSNAARSAEGPTSPTGGAAVKGEAPNVYIELLKDPRMWLIGFTMLFAANAVSIVFASIPPYAETIGVNRQTVSLLLSITGAVEIFCRGFHGWFSDRNIIPCLLQLALCSGITGMAAVACPLVGGPVGIGLLTAACGAAGTSVFSLVPIVIRQLLGADKVTAGMGIQLFFQSSSFVLSTYMTGYITGLEGSWLPVFYYIGTNLLIGFVLAGTYGTVLAVRHRKSLSVSEHTD